jgi:PAS domain S-box-containing protein
LNEAADQRGVVLANLPAGRTERRTALVVALALLGMGAIVLPFGGIQLPHIDAWVSITDTFIFIADLITWFLLISQFNIVRSRALLVLASGYLFTAVMQIPHLLAFPGVFAQTGLLGATIQTAAWIGVFALFGYPLAVLLYAVLKTEPEIIMLQGSTRTVAAASIAVVIAIVIALTWLATAGVGYLPRVFLTVNFLHVGSPVHLPNAIALLLLTAVVLLLLWFRGLSVLHLWLMVVMCGWLAQAIALWVFAYGRYSLQWYAGRFLFLISMTVVLVVLLKETMILYGRLAVSLVALRRLSAEKLLRSEAYLSEAQRLSHTGSFGWNVSTGEIYWSEETYKIFEYDHAVKPTLELVFRRIHPDERDFVQQTLDRASNERANFEIEYRLQMPGGLVKHLDVVAHALDSSIDALEYVGAVTDVTERKQTEEALQAESRERNQTEAALRQAQADLARASRLSSMGELSASLAHEINQPIAAVIIDANTCLRWLSRDQPDLEEARAAAVRIAQDGKRASEIVSRVRMLFRKGIPQRELVNVNETIQEMVLLLHSEATKFAVSTRTELATDLPQVVGDRVQLQQVLMNLMMNSIDAMKDVNGRRELTVQSQRDENGQVLISVTDTGIGLPPQQADQIFNAFFTTKPHGTGMGLRISRSIIESHGGRLWATGASGRGATFQFTLPAPVAAG